MSKILLVDDSAFMRKVLTDILLINGYEEISEAENGKKCLEKFNDEKPDVVLLDLIMPEKDGLEVLKEIIPLGAKVLVITAVGQQDMLNEAIKLGASGYIVKPFEETQILEQIKKLIANH